MSIKEIVKGNDNVYNCNAWISSWGNKLELKYKYGNHGEVKIYKLSKEELEEYLKKYNK